MTGAARARFPRWLVVVGLISVFGVAAAGASYWSYKDEWLRDPPPVSGCAHVAERRLTKPEPYSGFEAHGIPDGGTVYLRPSEDGGVRCVNMLSQDVGAHLALAYSIHEEIERAEALSALANRVADEHADNERLTFTIYKLTAPAMVGDAPAVQALKAALDERYACRYDIKSPCPRRPPMPKVVYAVGIPSAAGLLVFLGAVSARGFGRVRRWLRDRKQARLASQPVKGRTKRGTGSRGHSPRLPPARHRPHPRR